jgi:hypothetical protein
MNPTKEEPEKEEVEEPMTLERIELLKAAKRIPPTTQEEWDAFKRELSGAHLRSMVQIGFFDAHVKAGQKLAVTFVHFG